MERTVVVLVSLVLLVASSGAVQAGRQPVRSGTIEGGTGLVLGGGPPWEGLGADRSGCQHSADCLAWLRSGCDPALAGRDPAPTASIVDVGGLADGRTRRSLRMEAPYVPPWGLWPGAVVQLWRQDCTEIRRPGSPVVSAYSCNGYGGSVWCTGFRLPRGATWMTLSGTATTVHLSWTLT